MNRYCLTSLVVLFAFSAVAHAQDKAPELWTQIEEAAASIAARGDVKDYEAKKALAIEVARKIIASSSRDDVEAMIRAADDHLKRVSPPKMSYETWGYSWLIFTRVLFGQTEPNGYQQLIDNVSWRGLAVAAIDNHHDARSRDLLVELALKDEVFTWKNDTLSHWNSYQRSEVFTVYALGILRGYDAQGVIPKIEAVANSQAAQDRGELPPTSIFKLRMIYSNALLASWKYAASLDRAERDRYRDFERRLWRAWAVADGRKSRKSDSQYYSAAHILYENWKDGDDRFLVRIFEEPAITVEETQIATRLAHRLSIDAKKRLWTIAQGATPGARAAGEALEEISQRSYNLDKQSEAATFPSEDR